jgi:hypothetical protein
MRSLREALAGAPTAVLAAALAVLVLGAGLFGFAIAELTSGDGDGGAAAPAQAPAVIGGSTQAGEPVPSWPGGLTAYTVVIGAGADHGSAVAAAKEARRAGVDAGILEAARHGLAGRGSMGAWLVYNGTFAERAGALDLLKRLGVRYPGARVELVQSSQ